MAQKLGSAQITLILRNLDSLKDLAEATQTCRTWCWQLWRDEEQYNLWKPHIVSGLKSSVLRIFAAKSVGLAKMAITRKLGYKDRDAIFQTLCDIDKDVSARFERNAKGFWCLDGLWKDIIIGKPMQGTFRGIDTYAVYWSETGENGEKARYDVREHSMVQRDSAEPSIYCVRGTFNAAGDIEEAEFYSDKQLVYEGEWKNGTPWGKGIMYNHEGQKEIVGDFKQGTPHGEAIWYRKTMGGEQIIGYQGGWNDGKHHGPGTAYFENGEKHFSGDWEEGERVMGTWYDMDGRVVHQGTEADLQTRITECHDRHQCTFAVSGRCYVSQEWFNCRTCFGDENMVGICLSCARRDHAGHNMDFHETSEFFCDCGPGDGPNPCTAMIGCDNPDDCDCDLTPNVANDDGEDVVLNGDEDAQANAENEEAGRDDSDDDDDVAEEAVFRAIAEQLEAQFRAMGRDGVRVIIQDANDNGDDSQDEEGDQEHVGNN